MFEEHTTLRAILELSTLVWLLVWALRGARRLLMRKRESVSFLFLAHFVLCGVPLMLDNIAGRPDLHLWPGYDTAAADNSTAVAYCLYIAFCPLVWWYFGRSRGSGHQLDMRSAAAISIRRLSWPVKTLLHVLLFAPIVVLYFAPNPSVYSQYAAILRARLTADEASYHFMVGYFINVSVLAGTGLMLSQRKLKAACIYILPVMFLDGWMDGKRAVVVLICVMFTFAIWVRGVVNRRALVALIITLAIGFLGFSALYQYSLRGFDAVDHADRYNNIRLDYGRDDGIRLSLYAELHPEMTPILEYRLESLLFDATFFIPRELWPNKPWPYAVYATSAAFRLPVSFAGWGVTTSWLAEAIANFGWFGAIIGPWTIALVCRIGDSARDPIVTVLTVLVACLLMVVQFPAFVPLAIAWAVSLVLTRRFIRHAPGPLCALQSLKSEYGAS